MTPQAWVCGAVAGAVLERVAGSTDANAFKNLADFLGTAIAMNDVPLALEILKKMGETTLVPASSYSRETRMVGAGSGCSTKERKEAILAALCAFEWDTGMSVFSDTNANRQKQESDSVSGSLMLSQLCTSFAFEFVVRDFTVQSQLISNNKSQKAKDLHSRATACLNQI